MITFKTSDFPSMATHCNQSDCGFSLYRGVLVQWDEDHDERILRVIDEMPANVIDRLLVVQEHEGCIAFVWGGDVPKGYEADGPGIIEPEGDWWCITSSIALPNATERHSEWYDTSCCPVSGLKGEAQ